MRRFAEVLAAVATIAGMLMTAIIVASATLRYLIGAPLNFTEELVGLLSCTMAFLALPLALFDDGHIRITLITDRLGRSSARMAEFIGLVFVGAFLIVFIYEGCRFAAYSWEFRTRSEIADLTLWPWMMAMPGVCVFVLLVVLWRAGVLLRGRT